MYLYKWYFPPYARAESSSRDLIVTLSLLPSKFSQRHLFLSLPFSISVAGRWRRLQNFPVYWNKVSYVSIVPLPSTHQPVCRHDSFQVSRAREFLATPTNFRACALRRKMAHFCCSNTRLWGAKWRLFIGVGARPLSSISVCKSHPLKNCRVHQQYGDGSIKLSLGRSLSTDSVFYPIIHATETSFKAVHTFSHLPWWGVVISTTVALRLILTLPLAVHQSKTIAKMELLLPTLKQYQEAVKHNVVVKCRRANLPVEEANRQLKKAVKFSPSNFFPLNHVFFPQAKKVARDLYSQEGCSPYRVALLPWVQLPLWITLSFALRNMAGFFPSAGGQSPDDTAVVETSLSAEGCLWFQDLTASDPYFILPIILVTSNLCNIEVRHTLGTS